MKLVLSRPHRQLAESRRHHFEDLRDALNEMLAGKAVTKTGGAAFGCTIKRVS
jgi:hypothetical protein